LFDICLLRFGVENYFSPPNRQFVFICKSQLLLVFLRIFSLSNGLFLFLKLKSQLLLFLLFDQLWRFSAAIHSCFLFSSFFNSFLFFSFLFLFFYFFRFYFSFVSLSLFPFHLNEYQFDFSGGVICPIGSVAHQ